MQPLHKVVFGYLECSQYKILTKMLEEETFGEFYTNISDLRNSMVSLGKQISDVKFIRKILRSLPERFRIKVTTIYESKRSGGDED
jgi:hypothetical protein